MSSLRSKQRYCKRKKDEILLSMKENNEASENLDTNKLEDAANYISDDSTIQFTLIATAATTNTTSSTGI